MVYNQFLFKNLPFDPDKSVLPVTNLYHLIQTLVVNADLKVKSVDDLIAVSKARSGTLSYLTASPPLALYMEKLKAEKGADWVRVPFKGGGEAVNAIMSGSTPIGLIGLGNVIGQLQSGSMTSLAMLNNIRAPQFPDVPTLAETGYRGAASGSWYGLFVPAGTPRPIIDKLAATIGGDCQRARFPRSQPDQSRARARRSTRPSSSRRRSGRSARSPSRWSRKPACSRSRTQEGPRHADPPPSARPSAGRAGASRRRAVRLGAGGQAPASSRGRVSGRRRHRRHRPHPRRAAARTLRVVGDRREQAGRGRARLGRLRQERRARRQRRAVHAGFSDHASIRTASVR